MFFDGKTESEKVYISQSHQKKPESKKEFLEMQKAEKAQKAELRLKNESAIKIQHFFRKLYFFYLIIIVKAKIYPNS